jgi:calcium binding protein 39
VSSLSSAGGGSSKALAAAAAERDEVVSSLCRVLCEEEVFPLLLLHMRAVDLEVRKDMAAVFNALVRGDVLGFVSPGGYMSAHLGLLAQLADGYTAPDVALVTGSMLRECLKVPHLHEAMLMGSDGGLSTPLRSLFETHVHNPNFEVAADAFETLQELVTCNKSLVFRVLNPNGGDASAARYHDFFAQYSGMLTSDNYVLKRLSLRLLSEFLLVSCAPPRWARSPC